MKEKFIDIMELALSAYSVEDMHRYFDEVKTDGLTEHGFPRLASDMGILIAHGRRTELLPLFIEMFDFCCRTIPEVHAANDFSVREIVCCLEEIEAGGVVPKEMTEGWRNHLRRIVPEECYDRFATDLSDQVRNWALFSGVSEFFRQKAGLCESTDFIEMQALQQMQFMDENGMYCDNAKHYNRQHIVYDYVPRLLYSLMLDNGYRGKGWQEIDARLKKAALMSLDTQSPNGELPFGGRSNGFLHNECCMIAVFEYEAKRYAREGNLALAQRFKAASLRALQVIELWLSKKPIRHIKNRFPTETKFGCEKYAYFNKYMITVASNIYTAYQICDDSIPFSPATEHAPCVTELSVRFGKLFLHSGGYGAEFDLDANLHYDANGLGRVHREHAPGAICLSCPCPPDPRFTIDLPENFALSACGAVFHENKWLFGADFPYTVLEKKIENDSACASLRCELAEGKGITEHYRVNADGVSVQIEGDGEIAFALPAFYFDGETHTEIRPEKNALSILYQGWVCRYETDGEVTDENRIAANRNGHYRLFLARGKNSVKVKIQITKQ